jgi:phage tail sheath protein FI
MTILVQRASDVRVQEIDLSQVITSASTAVGCQVVVSKQGSPDPKFFTTADDYLREYGNPDAQVSFDVYCGLDFFKEGDQLWARRAVHDDALYAGIVMYNNADDDTILKGTGGVEDPTIPDWSTLVPIPASDVPLALFYPIRGPGSYAKSLAIAVQSNNLSAPTGLAASSASTGGTLTTGTFQYQVSAVGENGETLASQAVQKQIVAGTTNTITLTWDPVPLANGYMIYGRSTTANLVGLMDTIGASSTTFTDTGLIPPDVTKKPITNPADLPAPDPTFTVSVFDLDQSVDNPVEQFVCTLAPHTDSSGIECELEERINPYSQYIQVTNNTPALMTVPQVGTAAQASMTGGDSGTAPTEFDVAAAYSIFSNKQLYQINTLINGGHSTPTVQRAMDALAVKRWDSLACLDVPSSKQKFQPALDYRKLTLNLNSSYSALFCPDVLEADLINGKQQYVPFSGWAAALCARTDRVANPSFSIAGLNRGLVDVLKTRETYDDAQATELFKAQVNYTRTFVGQGIALWEQQTLQAKQSALSWVSVRRIVNVMKTALYQFLLYSLQEPNDDFTGRQIVGACTQYLQGIKDARGISSFQVISDASNNSAAMFNAGVRRVTVIIVPMIPIHEIQLQMVISKQGISFQEALSQVGGQ